MSIQFSFCIPRVLNAKRSVRWFRALFASNNNISSTAESKLIERELKSRRLELITPDFIFHFVNFYFSPHPTCASIVFISIHSCSIVVYSRRAVRAGRRCAAEKSNFREKKTNATKKRQPFRDGRCMDAVNVSEKRARRKLKLNSSVRIFCRFFAILGCSSVQCDCDTHHLWIPFSCRPLSEKFGPKFFFDWFYLSFVAGERRQ